MVCPYCNYNIATIDYDGIKLCKDCYNEIDKMKRKYYNKPPVDFIPHSVWIKERINYISEAINKYKEESLQIPIEWLEEYNKLVKEDK